MRWHSEFCGTPESGLVSPSKWPSSKRSRSRVQPHRGRNVSLGFSILPVPARDARHLSFPWARYFNSAYHYCIDSIPCTSTRSTLFHGISRSYFDKSGRSRKRLSAGGDMFAMRTKPALYASATPLTTGPASIFLELGEKTKSRRSVSPVSRWGWSASPARRVATLPQRCRNAAAALLPSMRVSPGPSRWRATAARIWPASSPRQGCVGIQEGVVVQRLAGVFRPEVKWVRSSSRRAGWRRGRTVD